MVKQVVEKIEVNERISLNDLVEKIESGNGLVVGIYKRTIYDDDDFRLLVQGHEKEWHWKNMNNAYSYGSSNYKTVKAALEDAFTMYQYITYCETLTDLTKWLIERKDLTPEDLFTNEEIVEAYDNL